MKVIHKDATITPTGEEGDFPGTFEVVLSAPTKDRDGDTLLPDEWKQPLPEHITFDSDHGMSVATTVGSGVPRIDEKSGNLIVSGTYSSLPRAQEVRTLVNEGHIRTTSVAFMSEKSSEKDGSTVVKRELLNGAFVAIPSNREALVLSSKGIKAGARNSSADAEKIQQIHDLAVELGAVPTKSVKALDPEEPADDAAPDDADPSDLVLAVDAAIDQALALLANTDLTALPDEVQRAIEFIQTADAAADDLLDALGIPDPDEDATDSGASEAPASGAEKSAPVAGVKVAPVEDADSDAVTAKELEAIALRIQAAQFIN